MAVAICIDPDRIGGADDAGGESLGAGLIGPWDFPKGRGDTRAGGNRDKIDIVSGPRQIPGDAGFDTGLVIIFDLLFLDEDAIGIEFDAIRLHPSGAADGDFDLECVLQFRDEITHAEAVIYSHVGQETEADEKTAFVVAAPDRVEVEPCGIGIRCGDIGASLAEDEAIHIMAVTRRDCSDPMAAIQQGKPIAIEQVNISLHGGGGEDLQCVDIEGRSIAMFAGARIELETAKWHEPTVEISRMIERDHLHPGCGADGGKELGPILLLMIHHGRSGSDGEGIEVAMLGGDLIADDGCEC